MKCLLWLLLWSMAFHLSAQHPTYIQYTSNNGLPSSEVYDMIQDDYGYLWFATNHGICRYDGYDFDYYDSEDGLTDNVVFSFTKDRHGDIWCTTFNHTLFLISGQTPRFSAYRYNHLLQKLPPDWVLNVLKIDRSNNVYLNFVNAEGYLFISSDGESKNTLKPSTHETDSSTHLNFLILDENDCFVYASSKQNESLRFQHINYLYASSDKSDAVIFGEDSTIFSFHGNQLAGLIGGEGRFLKEIPNVIIHIGLWDQDHFWVSSLGDGIGIYHKSGAYVKNMFSGKYVTDVFKDTEGSIWVSTLHNGVFHITNHLVDIHELGIVGQSVSELQVDENGTIWAAMQNGDIYWREHVFSKKGQSADRHSAHLATDKATDKLYYSLGSDLYRDDTIFKRHGPMLGFKLGLSEQYPFLIYGNQGLVVGGESYKYSRVHDVELYNGTLYLATKNGLARFEERNITQVEGSEMFKNRIDDIQLFDETMLLASKSKGIVIYSDQKTPVAISKKNGLTSNFVNKLYVQNDTTLWACTNAGLNRLIIQSGKLKTIHHFSVNHGLPGNEIHDVVVLKDTAWVGTKHGLCSFSISDMLRQKPQVDYQLEFKSVSVNDQEKKAVSTLNLDHNSNRIEFEFSGKSFVENSDLEYRYKLEGLQSKWRYTTQRKVLYTSLAPGNYTFIVQVKGTNKLWGEEIRMSVNIAPPFWTTWWFITAVIISLILVIYLFFRYRVLQYNRDVLRELVRQFTKRLRRAPPHIIVKESGTSVKINTQDIMYVRSDGNYIEIHTPNKKYVVREKISNFLNLVPDPIEFLQIRRSAIVRIDHVSGKGKKHVIVAGEKIEVGNTYLKQLEKITL